MEYPLNQSSWSRAAQDAVTAQKTAKFMWVGEGVLAVAGGVWFQSLTPENPSTWDTIWRAVLGGLTGLLVAVLVIFVWNLFRAPYKQRNEVRKLLKEKEDSKVIKRKEILEALTSIYYKGSDLLSQEIKSDDELKDWKASMDIWQAIFLKLVKEHISQTDYALYRLIQYKPNQKRINSYNPEHNDLRNKLGARLIQVEELIQRFKM